MYVAVQSGSRSFGLNISEFGNCDLLSRCCTKASANKPLSIKFLSGLSNETAFLNFKRLFRLSVEVLHLLVELVSRRRVLHSVELIVQQRCRLSRPFS